MVVVYENRICVIAIKSLLAPTIQSNVRRGDGSPSLGRSERVRATDLRLSRGDEGQPCLK